MKDLKITANNLLVYRKGETLKSIKEAIQSNNLAGLRIFAELKDDRLDDISFLREYTFLEQLDITSANDFDFSFLYELSNLKKLSINVEGKNELDLKGLKNLEYLSVQWRKKIKGFEQCTQLSSLSLIDFKEVDLQKISVLKSLQSLRIKTSSIQTLNGIENLTRLQKVAMGNCKKLHDLKALSHLVNLKELFLDICPSVRNYEAVVDLPNLETLSLIDCGKIASLRFIENYPLLNRLSLLGTTLVADGNLMPAKRIKYVEHKHYDHYNVKIENAAYEENIKNNLRKIQNMFK